MKSFAVLRNRFEKLENGLINIWLAMHEALAHYRCAEQSAQSSSRPAEESKGIYLQRDHPRFEVRLFHSLL